MASPTLRQRLAGLLAEQPGQTTPELAAQFPELPSASGAITGMLGKMFKAGELRRVEERGEGHNKLTYRYFPAKDEEMTWDTYESAAHRTFPKGTRVVQERGGVNFYIPCAEGHSVLEHFNKRMPPDKAKVHLGNKGWNFWGKRTRCPEHNKRVEQPVTNNGRDEIMEQHRIEAAAVTEMGAAFEKTGVTPDATAKVREAKRLATLLLEEQFDVVKGAYRNGFSDAKVAHETGVSPEWVKARREEDYGPIREPSEIAEFREQVAAVEAKLFGAKAQALAANEAVELVGKELDRLRNSIEIIVRRNGW